MKFSFHLCVLLISASLTLAVPIEDEFEASMKTVHQSLSNLLHYPFVISHKYSAHTVPLHELYEKIQILDALLNKVENSSLTLDERKFKYEILSMISKILKFENKKKINIISFTNDSYHLLPENVKFQLISSAFKIDLLLKKLRNFITENELKTSMTNVLDSLSYLMRTQFVKIGNYMSQILPLNEYYKKIQILGEKLDEVSDDNFTIDGRKIKEKISKTIQDMAKAGKETKNELILLTTDSFHKLSKNVQTQILNTLPNINSLLKSLQNTTSNYELDKKLASVLKSLSYFVKCPYKRVDPLRTNTTLYNIYQKIKTLGAKLNEVSDVSLTKDIKQMKEEIIQKITKFGKKMKKNVMWFKTDTIQEYKEYEAKLLETLFHIDYLLSHLRTSPLIEKEFEEQGEKNPLQKG